MKPRPSDRQATFSPLLDKTVKSLLLQLFCREFGYQDKSIFADAMVDRILETIESFTKERELLKSGQLLWMAVAVDGRKHAMKAMRDIPKVPVILDFITQDELKELADGVPFPIVRKHRHARLFNQALEQGGVLAQSDLSALSLCHRRTIYDDIQAIREEEGYLLPYRGSIQDLGATTTHKADVVRLLEKGHLEPEICELLKPKHNLAAVERYAQAYKHTKTLLSRGFVATEISSILKLGMRTVDAYIDLVKEHHPEIIERIVE